MEGKKLSKNFLNRLGRYVHGQGFRRAQEFVLDETGKNPRVRRITYYRESPTQIYWATDDRYFNLHEAAYRISQLKADGYGKLLASKVDYFPSIVGLTVGKPFNMVEWLNPSPLSDAENSKNNP